jgi:DNA mismatch repair protein MutL
MSRIAILPSAVADQIAAGEVVERPSSVVKELVENALDAGATTITITVEDGGKALVRIADDGVGMDRSDAMLSLSRHATSKITSAEQLVGVRSYGFRGSATGHRLGVRAGDRDRHGRRCGHAGASGGRGRDRNSRCGETAGRR